MDSHMAYCGLECSQCPAFIYSAQNDVEGLAQLSKDWSSPEMEFSPDEIKCKGCHQTAQIFTWCASCDVRTCAIEKKVENCAYCNEYPCKQLSFPHSRSPQARETLNKIYHSLMKL